MGLILSLTKEPTTDPVSLESRLQCRVVRVML